MGNDSTSEGTELLLVEATVSGSWKGAVLPGSAGLVLLGAGIGLAERGLIVAALAFVLAGALRATWWARACSTSRLLDRDNALVWIYRGKVRGAVPWSDLRHVLFTRGSRQIMWSVGPKFGGTFPYLLVDSRTNPPSPGFRHFAELMLLNPVGRGIWRALELGTVRAMLEAGTPRMLCSDHGVRPERDPWQVRRYG